ncbi:hypothetical protein GHK79_11825 [Enterococcus faecium]|nr:hypothetical protein [Enterococcus faecium]MBL3708498.1 hypothetical protein [Enterococcus faecium]
MLSFQLIHFFSIKKYLNYFCFFFFGDICLSRYLFFYEKEGSEQVKCGKKPTRKIKELISKQKIGRSYFNPENWLYRKTALGEIVLINRQIGKREVYFLL